MARRPECCNSWCVYENAVCKFCGWTEEDKRLVNTGAPRFYDIHTDEARPVTQADVDALVEVGNAYGQLRRHVEQTHANLMTQIKDIRSKAGLPA